MIMVVTDASLWVSVLLPEDMHHAASRAWLMEHTHASQPLIAPWILPAEVAGAIARRTGQPSLGARALEQLSNAPGIQLLPVDELVGRLAAQLAVQLSLKGADAVYVAVAYRTGVPLVTWDAQQRQRASGIVPTLSPGET
ncbi:MAG: type II toxin-antitoxin system VapC family toxin [Chloroflexi bacterium]|nr:type II toxin-antitoxin system VapC family toxin [Chloroflexota bacterium]